VTREQLSGLESRVGDIAARIARVKADQTYFRIRYDGWSILVLIYRGL